MYVELARQVEAGMLVKVDFALHTEEAYAQLAGFAEGVLQKAQPLAVALEFRKDADGTEGPGRLAAAVVQHELCLREHHVTHDAAILLHHEVQLRDEIRVAAILVQHEMLGASGTVDVPESLAGQNLHLAVIFRSFESDIHRVQFCCAKLRVFS